MKIKLLFKCFLLHLLGRLSEGNGNWHSRNDFLSYGDVRTQAPNQANPLQMIPSDELLGLFREYISSSKISESVRYDLKVLYDLAQIVTIVPENRSVYWINEFVRRIQYIFLTYPTFDAFLSSSHYPDMQRFAAPFELRIIEYTYILRDAYKRIDFKKFRMERDESENSVPSIYIRQARSSGRATPVDGGEIKMDVSYESANDRINYTETENLLILENRNSSWGSQSESYMEEEIDDDNDTLSLSKDNDNYVNSDSNTDAGNILDDSSDILRANFPENSNTGFYDILIKRSIRTADSRNFLSEKFVRSHPITRFLPQAVPLNDDILYDLNQFLKQQILMWEVTAVPFGFLRRYSEEVFDVLEKLTNRIDENVDLLYDWILYEQTNKKIEQMMRRLSFNETFRNSLPTHLQKYLTIAIHSDKKDTSQFLDYYYNQFMRTDCGILSSSRAKRVINGNNTSNTDWPWIVYIKAYPKKNTSVLPFTCVGVLVSDQFVVSAAHCFNEHDLNCDVLLSCNLKSYDVITFFGVTNASQVSYYPHSLARREVLSVDFHENYLNGNQFENDLMILKLRKPLELNEEATPICLPSYDDDFSGMNGFVAGWGETSRDTSVHLQGIRVDGLQEAMVPIIPHSLCEEWLKKSFQDYDDIQEFKLVRVLCAGYEDGWADACKGDSGGPLAVVSPDGVRTLAGIVSNGFGCGKPLRPGMYVDVARHAPWIKYKMAFLS